MQSPKLKLCIVQLTRIGDLVQTLQAARQFKVENPDIKLSLIAREKFAKGILFLLNTVYDDVILFETKDFLTTPRLKESKVSLQNFIYDINHKNFDLLVNLSFSKSSSYLCSLVQAKHKLGLRRNNKTEVVVEDKWSQYIYSNVMRGANNPFCLVDLYKYILGVKGTYLLEPEFIEKRHKTIVVHPFASTKKKRWGINKWNELLFKLLKDNPDYKIHVVGGAEDKIESLKIKNSPALKKYVSQIEFHAGNKSIYEVYDLLMDASLFIGHDSMVSHLASETLTKSIILSLGTVRPSETTPYSKNVVNIVPKNKCFPCTVSDSCELLPCHNSLSHQAVAAIASGIISKQDINANFLKNNLSEFHLDSIKVYTSQFTDHGLNLKEETENFLSLNDSFKSFYTILWQYYFREHDVQRSLPSITKATAMNLHQYETGINYLYELYNFGVKYSNKIINEYEVSSPNISVIRENVNKLNEIDQLCNITKNNYPLLANIIDYFYVHKSNAAENNIIDIAKHNLLTYYDASNLVAALFDFVNKTSTESVPRNQLDKEV